MIMGALIVGKHERIIHQDVFVPPHTGYEMVTEYWQHTVIYNCIRLIKEECFYHVGISRTAETEWLEKPSWL